MLTMFHRVERLSTPSSICPAVPGGSIDGGR